MINSFSKFNESNSSETVITMDDVKNMKHNLGYEDDDDDSFLRNYGWNKSQLLVAKPVYPPIKTQTWDGKEIDILSLYVKEGRYMCEIGYAITVDGKIEYLLGIYEPHGCDLNIKRGCVTAHGHEQIIKLWLDDGEFEEINTR